MADQLIAEGAVPQPDWDDAEDWAQFWAVDPNGNAHWFSDEPKVSEGLLDPDSVLWDCNKMHYECEFDQAIDLPVGIDWRTTLTERPKENTT